MAPAGQRQDPRSRHPAAPRCSAGSERFGAFVVAMVLDPVVLATGGGWMIVGTLLYVAYRRYKRLPLRETVKVESLTPLGVEEVEYRSVLVAFDEDDPFSEETVATARALGDPPAPGDPRRSRWSRCPRTCRWTPSSRPESGAGTKIERAKLICGQRVSGRIEQVRKGGPGQAIVDEAKAINAAAIVMKK